MKEKLKSTKQKNKIINYIPFIIILLVVAGIPLLFLNYQAKRSGLSRTEVINRLTNRLGDSEDDSSFSVEGPEGEKLDFLKPVQIGNSFTDAPLISHIQAIDLDNDNCTISFSFHASGDQDEDKMFYGTKISGTGIASVDINKNITYEVEEIEKDE